MKCAIQQTLGVAEECPGEACPFWEAEDGRMPEGCLIQRLLGHDVQNREVASWLAGLRRALETAHIEEGRLP